MSKVNDEQFRKEVDELKTLKDIRNNVLEEFERRIYKFLF